MLSNYLSIGFTTIILYVPKALILFCIFTGLKAFAKRKIEFLQLFTGRFVQLEDILMNTSGSFVGYGICFILLEVKQQRGRKPIVN